MEPKSLSLEDLAILIFEYTRVEKLPSKEAAKKLLIQQGSGTLLESVANLLEKYKATHTGLEETTKKIKEVLGGVTQAALPWHRIAVGGCYLLNYSPSRGIIHPYPWNGEFSAKVQVLEMFPSNASVMEFLDPPVAGMYTTTLFRVKPPTFEYGLTWWLEEYV